MTASVASFLTKAHKNGAEVPPTLSGALLLAAIRLSDAKKQAVRPYQLLVDDEGNLDLLTGEPPTGDGYAAPELRNGAVLPDDARVLVYAAGALAYELSTLTSPQPLDEARPEVPGPIGQVIRKAMAERQKRFKNLTEMVRAIELIHARPDREDERLILSAIAASTPLPPSQKQAKIELEKASTPEPAPIAKAEEAPPAGRGLFTEITDEPEADTRPPDGGRAHSAPERDDAAGLRAELEAERRERAELSAAMRARMQEVAELGTRLSLLEEQVRAANSVPLSPSAAVSHEVDELLAQRRFSEAERALQGSTVQHNALLQFRLAVALSSPLDAGSSALLRAEAAFRRAADLDPGWMEPRTRLRLLLLRQGKVKEGRTQLESVLRMDPGCPEALAALGSAPRSSLAGFGLSAAGGAAVAAAVLLLARPGAQVRVPDPVVPVVAATAAPQPEATPPVPTKPAAPPVQEPPAVSLPQLPPPERKAPAKPETARSEPEPAHSQAESARPARPEPKPRARKVAVSSSSRAAAEQEAAKGDKALRAFDTKSAQAAFSAALQLDPTLPAAHRGMGMVYVLLGKNAEAKAAYGRYLQLAPDAPDKDQIARLIAR